MTDRPASPLPLDQMLCFALYSTAHAVQAAYKPRLEALGLTYPQFLVLTVLWQTDDQTVGQLGQALHLESNTLTPLLKRMETAQLVTRKRDPADERQVRIALAPLGAALRQEIGTVTSCLAEQGGLEPDEIAGLQARLTRLRDRLRAG